MNKKYIMLGNGGHADVCRDIAKKGGYIEIGYVLGVSIYTGPGRPINSKSMLR